VSKEITLRDLIEETGQSVDEVLDAKLGKQDREKGITVNASIDDRLSCEITIYLWRIS
jgi:hypothetical protein